MISVFPFDRGYSDQVLALWRLLHPDWRLLEDRAEFHKFVESGDAVERIGYVVQRADAVIASVFGTCARDRNWARTRFLRIEVRPEDIAAAWLDPVLASFIEVDQGQPDTWHVVNVAEPLSLVLAPLLESAGFAAHCSRLQMEWSGDSITVEDPSPARLERYAGGDRDIDRSIVDLRNRCFRPWRLEMPVALEDVWPPLADQDAHEFVLALENDCLVGFSEWYVIDGEPWLSSSGSSSPWGTAVGGALGTKTMQILLGLGHRKLNSIIRSNNTASMRLHLKFGWKVAHEVHQIFVRRL
jgi:hypothetical protein